MPSHGDDRRLAARASVRNFATAAVKILQRIVIFACHSLVCGGISLNRASPEAGIEIAILVRGKARKSSDMRNRQYLSISLISCLLLACTTFAATPAAQDAAGRDDAPSSADAEQRADETGIKQSILYATLTARVKSELLVNQNTHGLAINVDSHNGAVTLSGEVATSTEKVLAERIASNVNGTASVSNRLVVKPRKQAK